MNNKKKIIDSPFFILGVVIVMILGAIALISYLFEDEPEIIEEKVIEIPERKPYIDYYDNCFSNYPYLKYEDDDYTSMFGIDVAAHQETIDWKKVKEAGVEFAYIRLGYRGALEGIMHIDDEFENNYMGATKNGIKVGIYWYAQPSNEIESIEEANFVLDVLNGRHLDLPIAYDFEETEFYTGELSRMHGMSKSDRTLMANAFCDIMKKNNLDTIIYANQYWADNYYDYDLIKNNPLWFAQYKETPSFDYPVRIWQYCEDGELDGIDNIVDLDIMFIRKNDQN